MHASRNDLPAEKLGDTCEARTAHWGEYERTAGGQVLEDAETVEFSPTKEYQERMAKVARNMAASRRDG